MDAAPSPARVADATLHLLYAFDVGQQIDLDVCRERLGGGRQRPSPTYFRFEPEPVRVALACETLPLAGRRTSTQLDAIVYDFGALTLCYEIPFAGTLEEWVALSAAATADRSVERDATARAHALLGQMGAAVRLPALAPLVEDYLIFQVRSLVGPPGPLDLLRQEPAALARILRGETQPLSGDEMEDALSARISYGPQDLALVDWNAAILFEEDAADALAVLDFANAQLTEMRYLDTRLDRALDRSYEALAGRVRGARLDHRRVGRMQVDGAVLFERVSNALKLVGDQYFARLYRIAAARFHLKTWNESILRKLETIESIYQKLSERASTRRMEILEWLIILLIALGLVLPWLIRAP